MLVLALRAFAWSGPSTSLLAQTVPSAPDLVSWISPAYNVGIAGIFIALILKGLLVVKSSHDETVEAFRKAYELEHEAHLITQKNYDALLEQTQAAVEQGALSNRLLEEIKAGMRKAAR